jgi:hypothetical protein
VDLRHERAGELVLLAAPDAWFAYPFWLDDRQAPDYARTVDIHRKPGYDPCELFFDPRLWWPRGRAALRLGQKQLGFRTRFDVVPLDATRQATLTRAELQAAVTARPGPVAARVAAFTRRAFAVDARVLHLHDPLAVGVAIDPTFVEWEAVRIEIGRDGETRRAAGAPNCRVARRVARERFIATFLERVCPASS